MRTRMDGVHHKHRNISSAYLYETDARLYIKPDLFCACAIFRIKHAVKNISLLASRVPVRLDFFPQFSFSM